MLDFYLRHGQASGHSPNPYFDEEWYRLTYPKIALQVREGSFASGFDHYCQGGWRENDPHWLFDLSSYRRNNVDLTDAALQSSGHRDLYNHYLLTGVRERRSAHLFFSADFYRAQPGVEIGAGPGGAFGHYLHGLRTGAAEPQTSCYFDPAWYRATYPEVTEAIERGEWRCALHHYLCNPTPREYDPLADFSEAFYAARHTDVATSVAAGNYSRGYWHFIHNGARELRSPTTGVDLKYYWDHHRAVRDAVAERHVRDAFVHLLTIGRKQGLRTQPPIDEPPEEPQAKALFRIGADNLLPGLAREGIDFSCTGPAELSVILVAHDQFALTLRALASLRQNYPGAIELILVNSGSADETRHIGRYLRGAQILSFASNIGYLRSCNAALNFVTSQTVLYLNNDLELAPFAIQAGLRRLASDPGIGAVGGKIIRSHGLLQEAGCIIWRDGSTQGYLRDASPQAPEANFCRDVDFCSAAFLLVRAGLLRDLGGFDEAFAPAYFEDSDLCVRIAKAGYRVVFDPAVVVIHLEYGSSASSLEAQAQMARGLSGFRDKHAAWLEAKFEPLAANLLWARSSGPLPRTAQRILFIEDIPPLRLMGSGYVRSNDLVRVMVELGMEVTVFPVEHRRVDLAAMFADIPDRVEIMHDRTIEDLPAFLAARAGYYDAVWIGRTHNLDRTAAMLPALAGPEGALPLLILDTEAVAALREAARLRIGPPSDVSEPSDAFDLQAAITRELANAPLCDRAIAVNEDEAEILRAHGLPNVSVIGHLQEIHETSRPWRDRTGMLFVGAIHAMDAPNYDSLCWFVDEVLPLVEQELRWETRLTIAGYIAPSVDLSRFTDHARITLRGAVVDLEPLYNQHRLFIAPTRFAAGIPYKVHNAASHGLPVVATEILRRQLRWQDGAEILTAADTDPAAFARHIIALYRSESLWQTIRAGALARIRTENSRATYREALRAVLTG